MKQTTSATAPKRRCQEPVDDGSFGGRYCAHSGILEHDGKWYCKRHHPPSKKAARDAAPKCQYVIGANTCGAVLRKSDHSKYCSWHIKVIPEQIVRQKAAAFDKINALAAFQDFSAGDGIAGDIHRIIAEALETRNTL